MYSDTGRSPRCEGEGNGYRIVLPAPYSVIPAKAGNQVGWSGVRGRHTLPRPWIPAFAGMTVLGDVVSLGWGIDHPVSRE